MRRSRSVLALAVCFSLCGALSAQDKPGKKAYLTAEEAGPTFALQGEYVGASSEGAAVGLHLVAYSGGKFDAVVYPGGLPGSGWDGKTRISLEGKLAEGGVYLKGQGLEGQAGEGKATLVSDDGKLYSFKKAARKSPTLGAKAPEGAIVLFDGTNVDAWEGMKIEEPGLMGVGGRTKQKFKNFTLHLEFRTPFMPDHTGQARGNSGMYLLDQYECQILDSFGLEGLDNECGGIYKASRPKVNMCLPPLSWQTYDVDFTAATFDADGKKTSDATVTIKHNGVLIHENVKLVVTPGGKQNDEQPGALFLQNHGDPVRFQNIWIVEK